MKKQKWSILITGFLLIGVAASFLLRLQGTHKLGKPGLKMIEKAVYDEKGNVVGTNTVDLPAQVLGYTSEVIPVSSMELSWLPADTTYAKRAYQAPDQYAIMLNVVMMGTDRSSIHKPQICLSGQGWKIDRSEALTIPISGSSPYELSVMKLTAGKTIQLKDLRKATYRTIYVYWFVEENRLTAQHRERMWWMAAELVKTGTLQRWAYVSFLSHCLPGEEEATYHRMKEFMQAAVPTFQLANGRRPTPLDHAVAARK